MKKPIVIILIITVCALAHTLTAAPMKKHPRFNISLFGVYGTLQEDISGSRYSWNTEKQFDAYGFKTDISGSALLRAKNSFYYGLSLTYYISEKIGIQLRGVFNSFSFHSQYKFNCEDSEAATWPGLKVQGDFALDQSRNAFSDMCLSLNIIWKALGQKTISPYLTFGGDLHLLRYKNLKASLLIPIEWYQDYQYYWDHEVFPIKPEKNNIALAGLNGGLGLEVNIVRNLRLFFDARYYLTQKKTIQWKPSNGDIYLYTNPAVRANQLTADQVANQIQYWLNFYNGSWSPKMDIKISTLKASTGIVICF